LLAGAALPVTGSAFSQCVTDMAAVDACLGGVRIARPAGATLDLNFMSAPLDPRITFTRASTATYTDASGVIQTAAVNAPRWDYASGVLRGLLIEEARTNLALNSATLGTQGVAVTAQAYTLSFYGTGTVTKSGAATGALVGTGTGQRVSQTFTPTAGTVTCTVTGSVLNAQLEAGSFPTSWIPTAGASATRSQDIMTMPTTGWFGATAGTIMADAMLPANGNVGYRGIFVLDGGPFNVWLRAYITGGTSNVDGSLDVASIGFGISTPGTPFKIAATYSAAGTHTAFNGAMGTGTAAVSTPATWTTLRLGVTDSSNANPANGYFRRVQYWPRVLSDAEMQSVTL
jgi:hypothetical protein